MARTIISFLDDAFLLAQETPFCAKAFHDAFDDALLAVQVSEEKCWVRGSDGRVFVFPHQPAPSVREGHVTTRLEVVLDLIEGRMDLLAAVRDNALRVRAGASELSVFLRALSHLVDGVTRSAGAPALLEKFRIYVEAKQYGQANGWARAGV